MRTTMAGYELRRLCVWGFFFSFAVSHQPKKMRVNNDYWCGCVTLYIKIFTDSHMWATCHFVVAGPFRLSQTDNIYGICIEYGMVDYSVASSRESARKMFSMRILLKMRVLNTRKQLRIPMQGMDETFSVSYTQIHVTSMIILSVWYACIDLITLHQYIHI